MPSRKIPRSYTSIRGNLYSYTLERMVGFESRLEKETFIYLDWIGTTFKKKLVTAFEEQPSPVIWNGNKYTPDVLIHFETLKKKPWLCEIKYTSKLENNWPYWRKRFKQAIRHARENGMVFKILTEREIKSSNTDLLWFMRTHTRTSVDAARRDAVRSALKKQVRLCPRVLAHDLGKDDDDKRKFEAEIWRMAAVGEIFCDIWCPRDKVFVCLKFPRPPKFFNKKWLFTLGHNSPDPRLQREFNSQMLFAGQGIGDFKCRY